MSEAVYDDIFDRLNALVEREKVLRKEIADIQAERARLKAQLNISDVSKPRWVSDLPEEFWLPTYYASKVINDLSPSLENSNTPPDLLDWVRGSGVKEFIVNTAIGLGIAIIGLQLFFFIF